MTDDCTGCADCTDEVLGPEELAEHVRVSLSKAGMPLNSAQHHVMLLTLRALVDEPDACT